jgi:hypothetical protein
MHRLLICPPDASTLALYDVVCNGSIFLLSLYRTRGMKIKAAAASARKKKILIMNKQHE